MGDSAELPDQDHVANPRFERRAVVRVKCDKAIVYAAGDSVTYFEGRILDLSANGVGMRVRRKLEVENTVAIILKKAGIFQAEHFAKVIYVRPEENGSWIVGCEFGAPLTPEELRSFQVENEATDNHLHDTSSRHG